MQRGLMRSYRPGDAHKTSKSREGEAQSASGWHIQVRNTAGSEDTETLSANRASNHHTRHVQMRSDSTAQAHPDSYNCHTFA